MGLEPIYSISWMIIMIHNIMYKLIHPRLSSQLVSCHIENIYERNHDFCSQPQRSSLIWIRNSSKLHQHRTIEWKPYEDPVIQQITRHCEVLRGLKLMKLWRRLLNIKHGSAGGSIRRPDYFTKFEKGLFNFNWSFLRVKHNIKCQFSFVPRKWQYCTWVSEETNVRWNKLGILYSESLWTNWVLFYSNYENVSYQLIKCFLCIFVPSFQLQINFRYWPISRDKLRIYYRDYQVK